MFEKNPKYPFLLRISFNICSLPFFPVKLLFSTTVDYIYIDNKPKRLKSMFDEKSPFYENNRIVKYFVNHSSSLAPCRNIK